MKGFVLAVAFSIGILFSSQAMAQECCQPVRNAVRAVVSVPVNVVNQVQPVRRAVCFMNKVRPVRRVVCRVQQARPVRRMFGCCR